MRGVALWIVVLGAALGYPLVVLAGGTPAFPSREDCVGSAPTREEGPVVAVFGYYETKHEAEAVRDRALEVGFLGVEVERDGCGRMRVFLDGIPSLTVGREFSEQARTVDFDVTLEQAD